MKKRASSLPETNMFAPENQWLVQMNFPFWGIFWPENQAGENAMLSGSQSGAAWHARTQLPPQQLR